MIINKNIFDALKELEPRSVQTCITSPPYFGLRQYLFDGAVIWRYDISDDERARIKKELEEKGIAPKQR